jgi:hypothetical protein
MSHFLAAETKEKLNVRKYSVNCIAYTYNNWGYYATSRKVSDSRQDEVTIFFNLPNPSGSTRPWGLLSLQQK